MDIVALIEIARKHEIDAVHPGYGFLSESADFARRMREEADVLVVGPGWEILETTGDKLRAKELASKCNVPISPSLLKPTSSPEEVARFANEVGFPIMVKAVDGGGGRGIRLVRDHSTLKPAVTRAVEESPSKKVFAEKAAVDGFRHVEVQIIGDGYGNVTHLWERECSIQRRYQKIVEVAPSTVKDRGMIAKIIDDAVRMARSIDYFSLGTYEFLLNPSTGVYYFLEINPRLQVEHTITEAVTSADIVRSQLLLAQGASISDCGIPLTAPDYKVPSVYSIQLRITAEDPKANWTLSIGKVTGFAFPSGNGIRVDTHLSHAHSTVIGAEFDNLIAKIIITASSWKACVQKGQRALEDTRIEGIKTNIAVLRAIVAHPDFLEGRCDTQWLEREQERLLTQSQQLPAGSSYFPQSLNPSPTIPSATTNALFRKGDAWSLTVTHNNADKAASQTHHLEVSRILRNEFPQALSADVLLTSPNQGPVPYTIDLKTTTASASATTSSLRRANPSDAAHVAIPFAGKLIEVLVDEGDSIREGDVVCVVQQMKMELEVRSPRSGTVTWVLEAEDGDEVGEGTLAAIVEGAKEARL